MMVTGIVGPEGTVMVPVQESGVSGGYLIGSGGGSILGASLNHQDLKIN